MHATIDLEPEGKILEGIDVVPLDVIEERDPAPMLLNMFHVTTREGVVRREVLLKIGEPYRQFLVDDSTRALRTFRQVSLVVLQVGSGYVPQLVGIVLFSMPAIMPPVITPLVIRHAFGARAFVTLLGIGTASMPVGIALGAPLWGLSPDLTGSYTTAMWVGVAVTVAAVVLVCFGVVAGARKFAGVGSEDAQEAGE